MGSSVWVSSHKSVEEVFGTDLLNQEQSHVAQTAEHVMNEARLLRWRVGRNVGSRPAGNGSHERQAAEMSMRRGYQSPFVPEADDIQTNESQDLVDVSIVNKTEAVKFR